MESQLQESTPVSSSAIENGASISSQVGLRAEMRLPAKAAIFDADEAGRLRVRWEKIQIAFVDESREAVSMLTS